MNMFTSNEIRDLRKSLKMSAMQFAITLGVTENAVRRWEMGDRHPRYDTLVKMNELAAAEKKEAVA